MSRTGASTSRTSKSSAKNADRKSASQPSVRRKNAPPLGKMGRAKPAPRPDARHEIRTRESSKAPDRRTRMPAASRRTVPDVPRKRKAAPPMNADDRTTMKRTATNKSKTVAEEKEKRAPVPPAEQVKAKAAPAAKEAKSKAPKAAAKPPRTEPVPARRKRGEDQNGTGTRAKSGRGARSKSFGFDDELMADYVMDDDVGAEGLDEELTMEPMELPLELLDPELVEVPRPAATPKPKPKPVSGKRQQVCANCGNTFAWLSVDQLCFNCLKKKLSQRKREDETYPGFTGEAEEEEDAS